jgi:hypothetical protein
MGVGEILDTGINLARRNYRALVMVVAWAIIPVYVLAAVLRVVSGGGLSQTGLAPALARGEPGPLFAFVVFSAITGVAVAIANALATAALTIGYARLIEPGRGPAHLEAGVLYRAAASRILPLILLFIVEGLAAILLIIVFPLGIYVFVRWSLSGIVLMIERTGPIVSLRRSRQLTRGSWWHTLGVLLAGAVIFGILSLVFGSAGGAIAGVVGGLLGSSVAVGLIQDVTSAVAGILVTPFSVAYLVVLYYELRARTEGYDLEQRAAQVASAE